MNLEQDTRRHLAAVAAIVGGATFVAFGLWALLTPVSFFETVAHWPPYNPHLIRDSGAFQIGMGASLLLAPWRPSDALTAVLAGGGIAALLHLTSHIIDHPLGGRPLVDFPTLTILAVALIVATWASARTSPPQPPHRPDTVPRPRNNGS